MKFYEKAAAVEAFRYKVDREPGWFQDAVAKCLFGERGSIVLSADSAMIETPEGVTSAFEGDWIIRKANGELSTCKPGLFETTYESR